MKIDLQRLIDLHVEHDAGVPSNREVLWYEISEWQIKSLKELGMRPNHVLLDIGCGPMRLGMEAVPYLDSGNFCGVDPYPPYKALGEAMMREIECEKEYVMEVSGEFPFQQFDRTFDYAIAQSVITHLSLEQITLLFANLKEVMNEGGVFLFTFNHNAFPLGFLYEAKHPMMAPSFVNKEFFKELADKYSLTFTYNPTADLNHPTGQAVATLTY